MAGFLATIRELERFRQIYLVLVRHGFADVARRLRVNSRRAERATGEGDGERDERLSSSDDPELVAVEQHEAKASNGTIAERVRLVAIDLGPSFVKLGQIASTRTDLLPTEWVLELKKLQDEVEPLPYERIRDAVEGSLGAPLDQLYARFDERPLAAASIGQVHRAALQRPEGPLEVVVKVQRPGIRTTVASDLDLLHRLARLVESAIPESKTYNPAGLVDQFDQAITAELDFQLEAENAVRFRRNFAGDPTVRFPMAYREASTRQVLTLELLPGKKVYDAIAKDGFSGEKIAKIAIRAVMKMIFEDGFFHADPHPGNILISGTPESPVIGFIDLGMVGRLSPEMRDR
jgi:ubiquinone biosynthesis protein